MARSVRMALTAASPARDDPDGRRPHEACGRAASMRLLQAFKVATVNPEWNGDSWLLTNLAGPTATQIVGAGLWTASIVGFGALAGVVFGWLPASWWAPLAVGSALVSLAGLMFFPVAFPPASTIGALAVDAVVLVAVLGIHWVPADITT